MDSHKSTSRTVEVTQLVHWTVEVPDGISEEDTLAYAECVVSEWEPGTPGVECTGYGWLQ